MTKRMLMVCPDHCGKRLAGKGTTGGKVMQVSEVTLTYGSETYFELETSNHTGDNRGS